jgi:NADH-quinone oxidoreductase subunit M
VLLGFYPKPLLSVINPAVGDTLQQVGVSDPQPDVPGAASSPAEEESSQ